MSKEYLNNNNNKIYPNSGLVNILVSSVADKIIKYQMWSHSSDSCLCVCVNNKTPQQKPIQRMSSDAAISFSQRRALTTALEQE